MLAALKGGKPAASMDNGHIAPFAASGAASSGNPPARKSMWSVIKKEMVKNETPMFINFTKQVMALAAQKYNEELDQLCDLFASSSHSFSSGTKLQLPSLHNQSIRSSEPTNALARASQQAAHESPVPLSPISQRSSSPSSESEDDFWKNRRKNLGGTLEREHSDESFVAMSETPPPSEPKPAPTALPVDSAPPQPPPPETPTEVVEERPRASVAKRWEPQEMKRKPIANAFKAQNTNTVTLKRSAAKPHETSKQDEDQNQAVEEAVEEAEEQAQEHDGALTARPGESDQTRTRRQSPLRVLDRMNQQDHVAISTKLALQAIIQNKPEFGQLDRDSGEKLFEKIKAGLDGILDPNAAVDGLVQHVCSIVADDWPDLAGSKSPLSFACMYLALHVGRYVCAHASLQQVMLNLLNAHTPSAIQRCNVLTDGMWFSRMRVDTPVRFRPSGPLLRACGPGGAQRAPMVGSGMDDGRN